MIRLYDANETEFSHNGLILKNVYESIVSEIENGDFSLELKSKYDDDSDQIQQDKILKVETPRGLQLFRIYYLKKDLKLIYIKARHIFYDLVNDFIVDSRPTHLNCVAALEKLLNDSENPTKFKAYSNISELKTTYIIRKNVANAIFGKDDNSLLNIFGGYLVRDNFNIKILKSGRDLGYKIEYGKNLIGIQSELNFSNVVTVIMPTFVKNNVVISLPEKFIESKKLSQYSQKFFKEIRYNLNEEESKTPELIYENLRIKAAEDFEKNKIDEPKINYKINFVELSKTEEYKNYQFIEKLDLYDVIHCQVPKLNIDISAKITSYKYNSLTKKYIDIELGNIQPKLLSNTIEKIGTKLNNVDKSVTQIQENIIQNSSNFSEELNRVKSLLNSGDNGYIIFNRNSDNSIKEILVMDANDVNAARSVWKFNHNGFSHSSNGVNGTFNIATTADGKILADFIYGLKIKSDMIEAGVIQAKHLSIEAREVISNIIEQSEIIHDLQLKTSPERLETIITEKTTTKLNEVLTEKIKEIYQSVDDKLELNKDAVLIQTEEPEDKTRAWLNPITGELKLYVRDNWALVNDRSEVTRILNEQFTILEGKVSSKEDLALLVSDFLKLGNDWETYKRILNGDYDRFKESQDQFRSDLETLKTTITQDTEGLLIKNNQGNLSVRLGNSKLQFLDNGVEVAYVSNQRLFINSGVFLSSLVIGNYKISKSDDGIMLFFDYIGGEY